MVELSTIRDVVAIFSFAIGLTYYIMVLRNQQKNQKHAEETRKIQLLYLNNQFMREPNSNLHWNNMFSMEWENYDDFMAKYGWENNPEFYDGRTSIWRMMNFSGLLVRDGLIDVSNHVQYTGDLDPIVWSKFKNIIEEMRIRMDSPELYIGMEILAKEVDKYRVSKGLKPKGTP